jgi:gamma-glutamylcyclotransferase (GGCT)/AIG2-like uncharacterized protein YtfP
MSDYLFACGTLRTELAPPELSGLMKRLRSVGHGTVGGRLYDFGAYPGAVVNAASPERIVGEVFELPDDPALLAALDEYEGIVPGDPASSLFVRTRVQAALASQERLECWMYVYNRDPAGAPLVAGGDYLKLKGQRQS